MRHATDQDRGHILAASLGRPLALGYLRRADVNTALTLFAVRHAPEHPHLDALIAQLVCTASSAAAAHLTSRRDH